MDTLSVSLRALFSSSASSPDDVVPAVSVVQSLRIDGLVLSLALPTISQNWSWQGNCVCADTQFEPEIGFYLSQGGGTSSRLTNEFSDSVVSAGDATAAPIDGWASCDALLAEVAREICEDQGSQLFGFWFHVLLARIVS